MKKQITNLSIILIILSLLFLGYKVIFNKNNTIGNIGEKNNTAVPEIQIKPVELPSPSGNIGEKNDTVIPNNQIKSVKLLSPSGNIGEKNDTVIPKIQIKSVELLSPSGNLKMSMMPFVYNSLYRINDISDPKHAIKVLKNFPYLVCAEPGHLSKKEIKVAEAIKKEVRIFGYVHMGGSPLPSLADIKNEIDNIQRQGWYGVFIDQFGYDFGETRQRQNSIVDYAHSKGLKCFVNCWHIDDAFGNKPDSKHNPDGLPTRLSEGDWYLLESYYVSNSGYNESINILIEKSQKARNYKKALNINIASLSYKRDSATWDNSSTDIKYSYLLSLLMGFDGWWFTDRLESDSFKHGKPVDLDLGNTLVEGLSKFSEEYFLAKTDKYLILLDTKDYPALSIEAFELNSEAGLQDYIKRKVK
ncbi:MAG: hypothetical protein WC677_03750 [Clostridia bacterium]